MAVYGEMLLAFPELLKVYEVFKMKPRTGAGYGERYDKRKVRGYWSNRKSGKTENEGDLQVPNHQATLWAMDDFSTKKSIVEDEDFVERRGKIYRVIQDDDFSHEGGFTKCLMQKLAGPTDQQVTNENVDKGIADDY